MNAARWYAQAAEVGVVTFSLWVGCAGFSEGVAPGAAPGPAPGAIPEVGEGHAAGAPLAAALAATPPEIGGRYTLSETPEGALDVRVAGPSRWREAPAARGISIADDAAGGKIIALDGGRPTRATWVTTPLRGRVPPAAAGATELVGLDLDAPRPLLVLGVGADEVALAFGRAGEPEQVVAICDAVTVIRFDAPERPRPVRKPVIYLYPEAPTRVRVDVALARGEFTARWPPPGPRGWEVLATPSGRLVDPATGRRHRYLFWEARADGFTVEPARAHLVAADGAAAFLQEVCDAAPLTDDECGDFLTYWLPELVSAPWSLVELVGEPYPQYARLSVTPEPDTTIRLFLAIEPLDRPVWAGEPPLPRQQREGFVVVEWGGTVVGP